MVLVVTDEPVQEVIQLAPSPNFNWSLAGSDSDRRVTRLRADAYRVSWRSRFCAAAGLPGNGQLPITFWATGIAAALTTNACFVFVKQTVGLRSIRDTQRALSKLTVCFTKFVHDAQIPVVAVLV